MYISIGRGFHCSILLPIVTHIVCESYSDRDEANFYKFGRRIHIVHPEFLNQSMLCRKKLEEKDNLIKELLFNQNQQQKEESSVKMFKEESVKTLNSNKQEEIKVREVR